jgi:chemotaxis protein CheD
MVNIAQIKIAKPPDVLCALGLGSCVGVVLYDPQSSVSGMLHVLLPSSKGVGSDQHSTKYANPGLLKLQEEVIRAGAQKSRLRAKLAGGAAVLVSTSSSGIAIGKQNCEECLSMLTRMQIPIDGKDLGGTSGRSVYFETGKNIMRIKKLVGGESQL